MRRTILLLLTMVGMIIGFSGCCGDEQPPVIVAEYPAAVIPKSAPLPMPAPSKPAPSTSPSIWSGMVPRDWMPSRSERGWSAIIIHHSATDEGNAAIFDKWHREENGWNGVGYDFVIGNGTNSGDGEVEATYRWKTQVTGAHTGGTPGNWANEEGVGICLVGDFNRSTPTARQMESLAKLVRFLQQRYHIPKNRVYGHGTTPGGHVTDCPGRRFPMSWLKANISP